MTPQAAAALLAVGAVLLPAAGPARPIDAAAPTFELVAVRSALPADRVVGHRRSGLLCGPAGALRWRDVEPGSAVAGRSVAAALRTAGLNIFVPDPDVMEGGDGRTAVRIVATIAAAQVDACSAWRGLRLDPAQASVSAHGRLALVWRAYDRRTRALRLKITSCRDFKISVGAPTIPYAIQMAIMADATAASPALATAGTASGPVPPQILGCTDAELGKLTDAPV